MKRAAFRLQPVLELRRAEERAVDDLVTGRAGRAGPGETSLASSEEVPWTE